MQPGGAPKGAVCRASPLRAGGAASSGLGRRNAPPGNRAPGVSDGAAAAPRRRSR